MDEIIVYGVQTDFEDYFTITMYEVPEGFGTGAWIQNVLDFMNNFVDLINVAAEDPDFDPVGQCLADQAAFRSECLSLATNANNLCLVTIGSGARIFGPAGGSVVGYACSQTYSNAQSACNTAADNYSWPEANHLCAGATGD